MKKIILFTMLITGLFAENNTTIVEDNSSVVMDSRSYDMFNGAIAFTYGKGDNNLIIISDPSCPFCKKLAKDKENKLSKYRMSVILYPLPYHKESRQKIAYILDGIGNIERHHRYQEILIGESISYKDFKIDEEKLNKYIKQVKKFVKKYNVKVTPTIMEVDIEETVYYEL